MSKRKKVLIIDFEATCSDDGSITKLNAEIIQIGLVEIMISDMSIRREYMTYIKPEKTELTEYCTKLTGITKKNLKSGIPRDHLENILKNKFGIKNSMVVGWGRDDLFMDFEQYLDLSYIYSIQNMISDKVPLSEALKKYKIQFDGNHHDALVDARATAELFKKMFSHT